MSILHRKISDIKLTITYVHLRLTGYKASIITYYSVFHYVSKVKIMHQIVVFVDESQLFSSSDGACVLYVAVPPDAFQPVRKPVFNCCRGSYFRQSLHTMCFLGIQTDLPLIAVNEVNHRVRGDPSFEDSGETESLYQGILDVKQLFRVIRDFDAWDEVQQ